MIGFIDNILNQITMYRLVLYYLTALVLAAIVFGMAGILSYSPGAIIFSTLLITAVCWITNTLFANVFEAIPNIESVYITALILTLIITPVSYNDAPGIGFLVFASVWAMASKYILVVRKKHVFNPAAFGVALAALTIGQSATWWVGGNWPLFPLVVLGGLLVVRKIRRADLIWSFSLFALATVIATSSSGSIVTPVAQTLFHSSFFFLAFVMLTEPLTTPPSKSLQIIYGAIVGMLFAPAVHIGSFYLTPELALLFGNVFSYAVSPKGRFMLKLLERRKLSSSTYEFVFEGDPRLRFHPGQYLEWTLGHESPDNRGNRRYFTIASSPTERDISLGVRFYEPPSSFKFALASMRPGDIISASHLSGDFVLPKNKNRKLAFIAGGIGVTPFRSMVQYLMDQGEARSVVVLYSNKTLSEIAYRDVFNRAKEMLGIKTVYVVTNERTQVPGVYNGPINEPLLKQEIPDYRARIFYLSGPHSMVVAFEKLLSEMGVPKRNIKTDFFPGFA
jgi:ferredoxin-NADP reductase/Na+-transporting NADH:ubiquinone oxidoreductase subunit NqrB